MAASTSPRPPKKADDVVIPQGLLDLIERSKLESNVCTCLLLMDYGGRELIGAARQVEFTRRKTADSTAVVKKLPTTKAMAASFICPVHLFDADAIAILVNKSVGPSSTVETLQRRLGELEEAWSEVDTIPAEGMSVLEAYAYFLSRVLVTTVVDGASLVVYRRLLPHLLRDLLINHDWHIVQGNRRLLGFGTETRPNGLDNLVPFTAIMHFTVFHYCGNHTECGLSRTPFGQCQEAVNIENNPEVVDALLAAVLKLTSFISLHQVINTQDIFSNQAVLGRHFGVL